MNTGFNNFEKFSFSFITFLSQNFLLLYRLWMISNGLYFFFTNVEIHKSLPNFKNGVNFMWLLCRLLLMLLFSLLLSLCSSTKLGRFQRWELFLLPLYNVSNEFMDKAKYQVCKRHEAKILPRLFRMYILLLLLFKSKHERDQVDSQWLSKS